MTPEQFKQARDEAANHADLDVGGLLSLSLNEIDRLKQEIVRVSREGTPGVMHDVDRAFYKLVVKERDVERHRVDRLTLEVKELKQRIRTLQAAVNSGDVCECCIGNECDCMEGVTWGEGAGSHTVDEDPDELPRQED